MIKYFDLTWCKGKPVDYYFAEQDDWNQTLMTKINQSRAQLSVVLKNLPKPEERKLIISENCRDIVSTFQIFDFTVWDTISFTSKTKDLIQVFYDDKYVDITLLNEVYKVNND